MTERPRAISVLSAAFIAAGVVGLVYHRGEFRPDQPFRLEFIAVCGVRLAAIVGGVATFRGANWGRWMLLVWTGFHVVLSAFHALSELLVHAVLLVLVGYFLFRPGVSAYFRGAGEAPSTRRRS